MSVFTRIVVPIDFSVAAAAAWDLARQLAAADATLVAVNVVEPPYPDVAYSNIPAAVREQRAENEGRLARLTASAAGASHVEARVVVGDVTQALLDVVREAGADLMVVGVHTHHGLEHFLRGSVVDAMVRRAPCHVLVVKTAVDA